MKRKAKEYKRFVADECLIRAIFQGASHQSDVWVELYSSIYGGDWDKIEHVDGYPLAGKALAELLFELFIAFDQVHHPDVMAGGLWLNSGWSCDRSLGDWEVLPAPAVFKGLGYG